MTSHELAKQLLAGPDVPVVTGLSRSGYGEVIVSIDLTDAHRFNDETCEFGTGTEQVIELVLDDSSSHSSTPGT